MKIKIIEHSAFHPDETGAPIETTLAEFLADNSDGIDFDESVKITHELQTTGRSCVLGFVGLWAELIVIPA